ncbi:MAG: hypothetical protein IT373_18005 [Polyangiaceae bacterium]|nr:hypothetical protein [Polyangiaceae bacterium]
MLKTHIRSYAVTDKGDILVTQMIKGDRVDISGAYENTPRERRLMRAGTYLDVFRYEDDVIAWSGSPNGHDIEAATAFALLLNLFVEDVTGPADARRAL